MSTAALVLWIIALVLLAFGAVFAYLGMNSERAYWTQRDPSGDARTEATHLSASSGGPVTSPRVSTGRPCASPRSAC